MVSARVIFPETEVPGRDQSRAQHSTDRISSDEYEADMRTLREQIRSLPAGTPLQKTDG